jgi:outer membrane protein OmpA-like peptidoglycan-associated protein
MKKSYLLSLPLAAALLVPAAAQDPKDNAKDPQQPAQTQQTQKADQQPTASGQEPLKYERHEGFWGHMNPFARKKYVQRQVAPVQGRVNELDELTAKNSRMIADVDARSTNGIRQAMGKANEADSRAVEAGNRAGQAQQTADRANNRIGSVEDTVGKLDQYQPVTQAEVRFRPGQPVLSKKAKEDLDEMAATLKDQKGYIVEVQGFSAGSGTVAIENSRQMAQAVVRYMVLTHDLPVYRIYTVGMGNAPVQTGDGKVEHIRGGRMQISVLTNSTSTLASNGGSSSK